MTGKPCKVLFKKGVFRALETKVAGSISSEKSGSKRIISAGAPGTNDPPCNPNLCAGEQLQASITRSREIRPGNTRYCHTALKAVSRLAIPKGASAKGRVFSAWVCGA